MKAIQKKDEIGKWKIISPSYAGLSDGDAKIAIAQLRRWAREDRSNAKYRIINVTIVPS